MLARTADHLYWMSRFIERAESLARTLDAHYRHSLLPYAPEVVARDWRATLEALGVYDLYLERRATFTPASAFQFLAFDRDHTGSIVACLRQARENARAVRGTITSEMWETLNSTLLEVRGLEAAGAEHDIGDFLEWVRYRAHLSRGVTLGTMLRDESYRFTRIGTFLKVPMRPPGCCSPARGRGSCRSTRRRARMPTPGRCCCARSRRSRSTARSTAMQ